MARHCLAHDMFGARHCLEQDTVWGKTLFSARHSVANCCSRVLQLLPSDKHAVSCTVVHQPNLHITHCGPTSKRRGTVLQYIIICVGPAGLRHVAQALLDGPDAAAKTLRAGMTSAANGNALPGAPVCASAAYLRDRVGVPRDLPLPAARQLRAHLNWLIHELRS